MTVDTKSLMIRLTTGGPSFISITEALAAVPEILDHAIELESKIERVRKECEGKKGRSIQADVILDILKADTPQEADND